MKIPYRFDTKEVSHDEIRELQRRHLVGELTDEDKWLLDAILSWFANNAL